MAAMGAQADAIASWGVVPETNRYGQLKKIKQPVLVVNGHDGIMVPSINSFILQQHIPNATLIIYPDLGHGAIFQYPDLLSLTRVFSSKSSAKDEAKRSCAPEEQGAVEARQIPLIWHVAL